MATSARKGSTVDDHIKAFTGITRQKLEQIRSLIRKAAPKAEECINYGIPTYQLEGNLVHFGGFKNHIGFYPGSSGIAAFEKELMAYKGAKGSVQFPLDKPLPAALITKIVKLRVEENEEKASLKKSSKPGTRSKTAKKRPGNNNKKPKK